MAISDQPVHLNGIKLQKMTKNNLCIPSLLQKERFGVVSFRPTEEISCFKARDFSLSLEMTKENTSVVCDEAVLHGEIFSFCKRLFRKKKSWPHR
jgi:hypothetical protein